MNIDAAIERFEALARRVEDASATYDGDMEEFVRNLGSSEFPYTYLAMFQFIPRVDSLRDSIFLLSKERELYSAKVLYRSLIEHFLRILYIYSRYLEEGTDRVGIEYFSHLKAHEDLSFARSLRSRCRLLGQEFDLDVFAKLQELVPRFRSCSEKELRRGADNFHYKNIINHLSKKLATQGKILEFLPNILPAYSELSSFVHGGPATDDITGLLLDEAKLEEALEKMCALAFGIAVSTRELTFICFSHVTKAFSALCFELSDIVQDKPSSEI